MRNIRLKIEYDGTNYCGWQRQNNQRPVGYPAKAGSVISIQETIEAALYQILQEKIEIIVSGRTDSGVHAKAQIANFKTSSNISLDKLALSINALLPEDIAVSNAQEAPMDFHSRFCAKSKVYRYTILNSYFRSPLLRNYVYCFVFPLDIKLMRSEAKCLLGRHDFKAFCASGSKVKDTVRTIKKIAIRKSGCKSLTGLLQNALIVSLRGAQRRSNLVLSSENKIAAPPFLLPQESRGARNDTFGEFCNSPLAGNSNLIIIDIEANGFLYNMARNIAGTLIDIGRAKLPKGSLKKILNSKNRKTAGPAAPAKGLCLLEVKY